MKKTHYNFPFCKCYFFCYCCFVLFLLYSISQFNRKNPIPNSLARFNSPSNSFFFLFHFLCFFCIRFNYKPNRCFIMFNHLVLAFICSIFFGILSIQIVLFFYFQQIKNNKSMSINKGQHTHDHMDTK